MRLSFGKIIRIFLEDDNNELHDIRDMDRADYLLFLEAMQKLKIAHDIIDQSDLIVEKESKEEGLK